MNSLLSARQLARQLADFTHRSLETFVRRFMPDGQPPGFVGGFPFGADARGDLICLLGALHALGFQEVAGLKIEAVLSQLLGQVSGEETETFYSYRIAETLLRFGPFANNPLLQSLTEPQRREIACACDTTHIYEGPGKLRAMPNNFWGVLARAEFARQRLGLLESNHVLEEAVRKLRHLLFINPLGFFDDSPTGEGRYDIYSADMPLFTHPLAELIGLDAWKEGLRRHIELVSQLVLENGASVAWGRSIGLHSILINVELGAVGLRYGQWSEPSRALSLAQAAFERARTWFTDGLTNAHQHRSLSRYRRGARRAQMTLDCLIKLAEMAEILLSVPNADADFPVLSQAELFPPRDVLIPLDARGAAVWSYRNGNIAFQFPIVHAYNADYVPWFRAPNHLDSPVDTHILCGVPRVVAGRIQHTTHGFPALCEKFPDGLRLVYESFQVMQENQPPGTIPGRREVRYQIGPDGSIEAHEAWSFPALPEALSLQFAESGRPFQVQVDCASPHHVEVIDVSGMIEWRSYWGEINRTHEINFAPTKTLAFSWKMKPAA
jgi:hypothetical protein